MAIAAADRAERILYTLSAAHGQSARTLIAIILVCSPLYGALMGSFAFDSVERLKMVAYAALKAPLLIFATTALCLPGFFVLNTVAGLQGDFRRASSSILAGQAALALALASLGPFVPLLYSSGAGYRPALAINAAVFTIATAAGHIIMLRHYRSLITANRRHRTMLWIWVVMYAFVGIQMGWTLRPFIGAPNAPVTFFREEPFSNAYVFLSRLIF